MILWFGLIHLKEGRIKRQSRNKDFAYFWRLKSAILLLVILLSSHHQALGMEIELNEVQKGVNIDVKSKVMVERPVITLGDIAEFAGLSRLERRVLTRIELGEAPGVDRFKRLPGKVIYTALVRHGFRPERVNISIPEEVLVWSKKQTVTTQHIETLLYDAIREQLAEIIPAGAKLEIQSSSLKRDIQLPPGRPIYQIKVKKGSSKLSPLSALLIIKLSGREYIRRWINLEMGIFTQVPVLERDLPRGKVLRRSDIRISKRDISKLASIPVLNIKYLRGKRLNRGLKAGSPLTSGDISSPAMVKRGRRVIVIAEKGTLQIKTIGLSKEDGRENDFIRVINLSSRKVFDARVIGPETVKVDL